MIIYLEFCYTVHVEHTRISNLIFGRAKHDMLNPDDELRKYYAYLEALYKLGIR